MGTSVTRRHSPEQAAGWQMLILSVTPLPSGKVRAALSGTLDAKGAADRVLLDMRELTNLFAAREWASVTAGELGLRSYRFESEEIVEDWKSHKLPDA